MKKYIITGILLVFLSLFAIFAVWGAVENTKDDFDIKETLIYGNEADAKGLKLTLETSWAHKLNWTTEFISAPAPRTSTAFSLNKTGQYSDFVPTYLGYSTGFGSSYFPHGDEIDEDFFKDDPTGACNYAIAKDVASRAKPGVEYEEIVRVIDYFDEIPIQPAFNLNSKSDKYVKDDIRSLDNYFLNLPVPKDLAVRVTVTTDEKGNLSEYSFSFGLDANIYGDVSEDGAYLTVSEVSYPEIGKEDGDWIKIPLPPSFHGIYYVPFIQCPDEAGALMADYDNAEMIFPIADDVKVLELKNSLDDKKFYLITSEKEQVYLSVFDKKNHRLEQKILLDGMDGQPFISAIKEDEEGIMLIYGGRSFTLISKMTPEYKPVLHESLLQFKEKYFGLDYDHLAMDYDGKQLAFASAIPDTYDGTTNRAVRHAGAYLYLFDETGVKYTKTFDIIHGPQSENSDLLPPFVRSIDVQLP